MPFAVREGTAFCEELSRWIDATFSSWDRDLRQDVLMVCLQKLSGPSSPDSEVRSWAHWVRGVAWRIVFASRRSKSDQRRAESARGLDPEVPDLSTPVVHALGVERRDAVRAALAALPPLMRTAVIRVDMHNETYSAVSVELYGCDDAAARQRLGTMLSRARARLRKSLLSCAPETPAAFRRGAVRGSRRKSAEC
jgi:DNA-directed RNA polymerase specialized sigma24 family protein